jgi:hypothetical protein
MHADGRGRWPYAVEVAVLAAVSTFCSSGECPGPRGSTADHLSRLDDVFGHFGVQDRPHVSTTVVSTALATGLCIWPPDPPLARRGVRLARSLTLAKFSPGLELGFRSKVYRGRHESRPSHRAADGRAARCPEPGALPPAVGRSIFRRCESDGRPGRFTLAAWVSCQDLYFGVL